MHLASRDFLLPDDSSADFSDNGCLKGWCYYWHHSGMPPSAKTLARMFREPANVRFNELISLCEAYFGPPRRSGSHTIFKTPWFGDPRVNLQNSGGMAKAYQVRQVLNAIRKLEGNA